MWSFQGADVPSRFTPTMEAARSSETLVSYHVTIRRHKAEYRMVMLINLNNWHNVVKYLNKKKFQGMRRIDHWFSCWLLFKNSKRPATVATAGNIQYYDPLSRSWNVVVRSLLIIHEHLDVSLYVTCAVDTSSINITISQQKFYCIVFLSRKLNSS
jgi:hypothetical protein